MSPEIYPVSQANVCPRADELLDALGAGFIGEELESYIATCAACRELRLVAGALLDERVQAVTEAAHLHSPRPPTARTAPTSPQSLPTFGKTRELPGNRGMTARRRLP